MKGETSENELQGLLEAIKSSEVVESRAQLIKKLGELDITEDSELGSLMESLTWIFWEDFTCLDVSQCMLNKTILHVAATFLDSGISRCPGQCLALGTKASIWCGKHLKMTLMSTEESQEEEHCSLFFQLLLNLLSYSGASFSALARCPVSSSKGVMAAVEKFIFEQLNLTKECLSEMKKIDAFGSEVLKVVQVVLDAVIRVCRVYFNGVNWDLYAARTEEASDCMDCKEFDSANHITNVTKITVEKLCEVGILAANDGGNLVSVLNLSWKGVVALLQLGKGALALKVNIADIILILVTQANDSLRCAAESWSCPLKERVSVTEAKRIFLPVKFYLINAVRIISHYPSEAFLVYKDIILCVIMISTFRISLTKEEPLKSASEALVELLEPTSLHLLNSLLNSTQLKQKQKFQILDWLFSDETNLNLILGDPSSNHRESNSMDAIFSVSSDGMRGARILLVGRLALFLNLLKGSPDLEDDVRLGISTKLGWLMDIIIDQDIYSSILVLQIPVLYGSCQAQEFSYQAMFSSIVHALKTFMIVVSSTPAWRETISFLFGNFFHPHFLCWEIVMELLCFMVRHAEIDMVNDIIDNLCSLLRVATFSESVFIPGSGLRKIARSICVLLTHCSQPTVDLVYHSISAGNRSQLSLSMYAALLMEGFPLNLLSAKVKSVAKERIVTEYFGFLDNFVDESLRVDVPGVFGAPVFAISAALQSIQVSISDSDMKTLKLLVAVINKYRNSEGKMKDHYRKLLSETLGIISIMNHLYESDEMERVIIELKNLFISEPAVSDTGLFQCKPNLAVFMAGLGHIELAENDYCPKSLAVWELYHMLFRERHWAFVHLGIKAFGYFASRTSCNQLWRFLPQDAALSFDIDSGKEANVETFMSELKGFLEKEMAHLASTPGSEQVELLAREAKLLQENVEKTMKIEPEAMICCDAMGVDDEVRANKKRKLPEGISKGVQLLQSGLKIIGDGLSLWQQNHVETAELHDKFLTHVASLEDVIGHLVTLSGCE